MAFAGLKKQINKANQVIDNNFINNNQYDTMIFINKIDW